jgi:tetratricopeptide (TPR) repeat protein
VTSSPPASESRIVAQVAVTVDDLSESQPDAVALLSVLSFMGADDIPRRMLRTADPHLAEELGPWLTDRRALMSALAALADQALLTFDGSGVFIHRERQEAVIELLTVEERATSCGCAARLVLEAMPDPRRVDEWGWGARVMRHAIFVAGHLESLGLDPVIHARVRRVIARFQAAQGQLEGALQNLHRALSLVEGAEPGGRLHGRVLSDLADTARRLGEFTRALELAEEAYSLHRALAATSRPVPARVDLPDEVGNDDVAQTVKGVEQVSEEPGPDGDVAADLRVRGLIEQDRGDLRQALDVLEAARWMFAQTVGTHHLDWLEVSENIFSVLLDGNEHQRAIEDAERTIAIKEELGTFAEDLEDSRLLLGILTGDVPATDASRELSERFRRRYGAHHQDTAEALRLLGAVLSGSDPEEARTALEAALEVHVANLGPDHYQVARSLVYVMRNYLQQHDFEDAAVVAGQALDVVGHTPETDRATVLRLIGITDALADVGGIPAQRPFLDRVPDVIASHTSDEQTAMELRGALSRGLRRAGDEALVAGDVDRAREEYERAMDVARETPEPLDDCDVEVRLGFVCGLEGDDAGARAHWRAALDLFPEGSDLTWPLWFLVRVHGQLSRAVRRSEVSERALQQLVDDMQEEGKVTSFRASITSLVPDGWLVKESITLLSPDGQANVIASSEPLDPSIDTARYAGTQGELLRTEFPGFKEAWVQEREVLGGRPGVVRAFSWTPEGGVPVTRCSSTTPRTDEGTPPRRPPRRATSSRSSRCSSPRCSRCASQSPDLDSGSHPSHAPSTVTRIAAMSNPTRPDRNLALELGGAQYLPLHALPVERRRAGEGRDLGVRPVLGPGPRS